MAKTPKKTQHTPAERLLIVLPTSLGDTVMATPTLRAFRQLYPQAHITALVRRHLRPILDACPWVDRIISARQKNKHAPTAKRAGPIKLARRLGSGKFDTAILMPEGLRAALLVRLAGIPRRVGYDRNARGSVLTDRLIPRKVKGEYVPVPTREQYLGLARYLGAIDPDPTMQLFTRPDDDRVAEALLTGWGVRSEIDPATGLPRKPLVVLVPGAGSDREKIWPAKRFAEVADRCSAELNAIVAVSGGPGERAILDEVKKHAKRAVIDLPAMGVELRLLKSVIRKSQLVISNDTGPRHIAAAFGVPLVTLFGEAERVWSDTAFEAERHVAPTAITSAAAAKSEKKIKASIHAHLLAIESGVVFEHARAALHEAAAARRKPTSETFVHHGVRE